MGTNYDIHAAINALRMKRDALVADLDRDIAALESAAAVLARYGSEGAYSEKPIGVVEGPVKRVSFSIQDGPAAAKPAEVAEAASKALSAGPIWRPLAALSDDIKASGVMIGGADPVTNLSTIMSRHKEAFGFVGNKRLGWALARRVSENL